MEFQLKTLTPLWTGDIDARSSVIRETGIIGSLRWWYEAIVRGLGGYACDPTGSGKCEYDPDKKQKSLCPACYLFGTSGWARLFRLEIEPLPLLPLHFRSRVRANCAWLGRIFGGEPMGRGHLPKIDNLVVLFGETVIHVSTRIQDDDYAIIQLISLFDFIARYGGLGAKLQHGFGQVRVESQEKLAEISPKALKELKRHLNQGNFRKESNPPDLPTLTRFFSLAYSLPTNSLKDFLDPRSHFGNLKAQNERRYIPCTFDLRYKGDTSQMGFRQRLKNQQWNCQKLTALLGETLTSKERLGSRLFMGMPYAVDEAYELKVFGFVLPVVGEVDDVVSELNEYMKALFNVTAKRVFSFQNWLKESELSEVGSCPLNFKHPFA